MSADNGSSYHQVAVGRSLKVGVADAMALVVAQRMRRAEPRATKRWREHMDMYTCQLGDRCALRLAI